MVEQRAAVAAVFDRAAPTYDRVGVQFFAAVGRQLVNDAGLRPGQRVLDAGCGRGAVLFPAAAAVGDSGSVLGIDLAPSMVELAAADAAAAGLAKEDILPMRDPRATQEAGTDAKSPFDTDEALHGLLSEAGFADPVSRTREHVVRFADPDQWMRWSWSHGMRMFWERLPEDEQRAARVRTVERLRVMQAEEQGLVLRNVVRYTTARAGS